MSKSHKSGKKMSKKKRRQRARRIRLTVAIVAVLLVGAFAAFRMACALIDWQIYPLSTETIDLRGKGLKSAREVARLTGLRTALLSDNDIQDVSPLAALLSCGYIDLTGNPVTGESYEALRQALPNATILCEAGDAVTRTLTLTGLELPPFDALRRVISSHSALTTVDARGTTLTAAEIDQLRAEFPRVNFIALAGGTAESPVLTIAKAADIAPTLLRFEGIGHVTITGCSVTPDQYRLLKAQFPNIAIDCPVELYGKTVLSGAGDIDLSACQIDTKLEDNLRLFGALKTLTLPESTPEEAARVKAALNLEQVGYLFNGQKVTPETTEIDLRGKRVDAALLKSLLNDLPALETLALDEPDEAVKALMAERSDLFFVYNTTLLGLPISTGDEIIDFDAGQITVRDGDLAALKEAIPRLRALKEMRMFDSRLSQETMDALFDGFPDVFFGWTFNVVGKRYTVRSDVTAFSSLLGNPRHTYTYIDYLNLRYCKNLLALDLGHNKIITIDFLRYFPKLKLLILADNNVRDLTVIGELQDLEYIELFMNYQVQSFEPLANLKKLKDLNIRLTRYSDAKTKHSIEFLKQITSLERLWITTNNFSSSDVKELRAALPNCEISCTNKHSTDDGWRDDKHYPVIQRIFNNREYEPFE